MVSFFNLLMPLASMGRIASSFLFRATFFIGHMIDLGEFALSYPVVVVDKIISLWCVLHTSYDTWQCGTTFHHFVSHYNKLSRPLLKIKPRVQSLKGSYFDGSFFLSSSDFSTKYLLHGCLLIMHILAIHLMPPSELLGKNKLL